jgi:hypothetical protein
MTEPFDASKAEVTLAKATCNLCNKEVWALCYSVAEFNGFACEECINSKLETIIP